MRYSARVLTVSMSSYCSQVPKEESFIFHLLHVFKSNVDAFLENSTQLHVNTPCWTFYRITSLFSVS